jgi:hypothetical protein
MQTEFQYNRDGLNVKRQAPRETIPPDQRFADMLVEQPAPAGFNKPCQIFNGEVFRIGDETVRPRRYALSLRGIVPPKGAKFVTLCKVPGCMRHIEVKEA